MKRRLNVKKFAIFLLACYVIFTLVSQQIQIMKLRSQIEEVRDEIESKKETRKALKEEIEKMNDMEYIERLAREELGMVRPGEITYVPVEED